MTATLTSSEATRTEQHAPRLHARLQEALSSHDVTAVAMAAATSPTDRRDELLALALIHDLHVIDPDDPRVLHQHDPALVRRKLHLESRLLRRIERSDWNAEHPYLGVLHQRRLDPVESVRRIAHDDLVPGVYEWVAESAELDELRCFLALEGGPDAGFDDLVAVAQVGLAGEAKLEAASNYWDEMGRGRAGATHGELFSRMREALGLPSIDRQRLPVEALERAALLSTLATNRRYQFELLGALGVIELQAGPRCRRVVQGLVRLGAGYDARSFYAVHAEVDPRHGKDWLDKVIRPLGTTRRRVEALVRGAAWRARTNTCFFSIFSHPDVTPTGVTLST